MALILTQTAAMSCGILMFQSFYESSFQHPWSLLVVPVAFLWWMRKQTSGFAQVWRIYTVLAILDPLCAGPLAQALSPAAAEAIAITFVVLGDLRWFYFYEFFERGVRRSLPVALGWALVVPVLQALLIRGFPGVFADTRAVFLAYELLFLFLVTSFLAFRRGAVSPHVGQFRRELCLYAMAYYGLWAIADVVILCGFDVGFLLRVVPNQLYYALFLPFCWHRATKLGLLREPDLAATPVQS